MRFNVSHPEESLPWSVLSFGRVTPPLPLRGIPVRRDGFLPDLSLRTPYFRTLVPLPFSVFFPFRRVGAMSRVLNDSSENRLVGSSLLTLSSSLLDRTMEEN